MIGRSIAHYTVVEKLGQGGMGEVYKARDSHLDRFVALKVLPPEKVADPERKQRFVFEAKSASALNHPNIVHIYDIDSSDGVDFIAMEYVQGQTLDRLIQRKRMRVSETLGYALQIADALAKAHSAGIIHRDLKPSNIMVTDEGVVKVLDFGLAKLTEATAQAAGETATVTVQPLTERGVILGTVAYMSPEQAQGLPVDARSDIFSFGSLLYEMCAGTQPFEASSKAMLLASILQQDPKPLREIVPEVPEDVEKLVVRCMRKDPRRRWQNMSDLKVVLQDLKEESDSGRLALSHSAVPAALAGTRTRSSRLSVIIVTAAAVLLLAGALVLWHVRTPRLSPEPEVTRLTFDSGATGSSSISLDGKFIAYASDRGGRGDLDIYVQHITGTQPRALTQDPADDRSPSFSPDGSQVVFQSDRDGGGIYLIETNAQPGAERRITDGGTNPRFSPDGSLILVVDSRDRMILLPPLGGPVKPFQPDFRLTSFAIAGPAPVWSPDGKHVLFDGVRSSDKQRGWWVAPVDGSTPSLIGKDCPWPASGSGYVPNAWAGDRIIFTIGNSIAGINLFACGISTPGMKISCNLHRLTSGPGVKTAAAVSADGLMVFAHAKGVMSIWSHTLDPKLGTIVGEPLRLIGHEMGKVMPTLSADGSHLAYVGFPDPSQFQIRIMDIAAGREWVAATNHAEGTLTLTLPQLNGDGSVFAYTERLAGRAKGYVGPSKGAAPRQVCEDCAVAALSRDGIWGLVETRNELVRQNFGTGARSSVLSCPDQILDVSLSPDNKWLSLLTRKRSDAVTLYVVPLGKNVAPPESWIRVLEDAGISSPVWSSDGTLICYFSSKDMKTCVYGQRLDAAKRPVGQPFAVRHEHRAAYKASGPSGWKRLALGGGKLVYVIMETSGNIYSTQLPPE